MESLRDRRERLNRERDEAKRIGAVRNSCKSSIRGDITEHGYRAVKLQYEYLRSNPNVPTRFPDLSVSDVLECYKEVLDVDNK